MTAVLLIARREVSTRLQQRGFRISFVLTVLIAALACALPAFLRADDSPAHYTVGITQTGSQAGGLTRALTAAGRADAVRIAVLRVSPGEARARVRAGHLAAAVIGTVGSGDPTVVVRKSDDPVVRIVQSGYQLAAAAARLRAAGLSDAAARTALDVRPLAVRSTGAQDNGERQALSTIAVVVLFSQLISFCAWVGTGVVEEKSSRVVELVLAAVRPAQLLTGKLLGIGTVAVVQVLALGIAALTSATLAGTLRAPGAAIAAVGVTFVGFVLGFAFFAAVAAALGSTVSRQEEVSAVLTPVSLTLTACYGASFVAVANPGSTVSRVISIVPPFSAIAMPARIARGSVPALDILLAVVLLLAATVLVVIGAARVYRASILHSGTRVPLRRAWRGEIIGAG